MSHDPSKSVQSPQTPTAPPRSRVLADLGAMAVYCTIVYAWSWWIGPLGPDAARLAGEAGLAGPSAWALSMAVGLFGANALPYHLVNTVLIYACMVCVYLIVNRLAAAPSWLGVFAANLWMASPGHREATVALTGMVELLPCLAALLALTAFMAHQIRPGAIRMAALVVLTLVALAFPQNQWIGAVLLLFGLVGNAAAGGNAARTAFCLATVFAGVLLHTKPSLEAASLFDRYGALYFCFYGIGLLPETAERFVLQPWLAPLAVLTVAAMLVLVHRKAQRPAFVVAIAAMFVYRSSSAVTPVDPVHLVGGGSLVFVTALFMMGVGVLYARTMEHKRWAPILGLSSITISVVFFLLMITTIAPWREAARLAGEFHETAAEIYTGTGLPVVIAPDFHAFDGAPLQLSRLLSHDTPFGPAVMVAAHAPLDYERPPAATFRLEPGEDGTPPYIAVEGPRARDVLRPWDFRVEHLAVEAGELRVMLPPGLAVSPENWPAFGEVARSGATN